MDKEEIKAFGAPSFEPADAGAFGPIAERMMQAKTTEDVPDAIEKMDASWAGVTIYDPVYKRPFSYQPHEIEFCKKYNIAPYTSHFLRRFWDMQRETCLIRPAYKNCVVCGTSIRTSVNLSYPDRKVYCKECYFQFIEQNG